MSAEDQPVFEEKQYLGYNGLSMMRRLLLGLFCFAVYWWKTQNGKNGDLFFFLGIAVIVLSIILFFVLHIKISVFKNFIVLDGLWTTRKVKIDLKSIVKVERTTYSKYLLNNPVFNLHMKGMVRFYTGGNDCIEITDNDGQPYRIGTQRPGELEFILKGLTKKKD